MSDKFKNKYRIESNRWQYWDYSAPGSYFITVCIANRACILGDVVGGQMELSQYGEIVQHEFLKIPEYHPRALLDACVVMPNHVHCIITLGDYDYHNGISSIVPVPSLNVGGIHESSLRLGTEQNAIEQYRKGRRQMIIPKIMGKFQMLTSKEMNMLRQTPGRKNWQANYHDHVIRDTEAYERIKQYIINNPGKWEDDKFFGNDT